MVGNNDNIIKKDSIKTKGLQVNNKDYRTLFEHTGTATCIINETGIILMVNKEFERMSGYSRSQLIGKKSAFDFIHPDDLHMVKKYHKQRRISNLMVPDKYTFRFINRLKQVIIVSINVSLVPGSTRSVVSMSNITDIIESKKKVKRTLDSIINTLGSIVDLKDSYTANHERRVAKIAREISLELGLTEKKVEIIRIASLLHDIGKISIPSEILNKPGKLSDLDLQIIREHVNKSYLILKGIEFDYPIAEICYQHHERLDGSGYPNNLVGDDILIEAQIIAVADVVEAMSSHRPYRPALGLEAALGEIRKFQGLKYNFEVVKACLRIFKYSNSKLEFS